MSGHNGKQAYGVQHIGAAFAAARAQGRAAFMPYWPLGYPDRTTSLAVVQALAGADLIELGVPFSDPLADGPVIQRATQRALENGMRAGDSIGMAAELRRRGVTAPFLFMGYINPLLAYGVDRYVADSMAAGVDGLIVPDLPPEDAGEVEAACGRYGLALVYLVAPTSTPERLALVTRRTSGFVYLVSVAGVTGARSAVAADLPEFVARVRAVCPDRPLAVGFGVSTPEQAAAVGRLAEGVIVGSALVRAAGEAADPAAAAGKFAGEMLRGLI